MTFVPSTFSQQPASMFALAKMADHELQLRILYKHNQQGQYPIPYYFTTLLKRVILFCFKT